MAYGLMVDSARQAPAQLIAQVIARYGRPAAWALYMGTGGAGVVPATRADVDRVHAAGIPVLPIYNDVRVADVVSATAGTFAAGECIGQATRLGVPPGCYVAFDLEAEWKLGADWLKAFCAGIRSSLQAGAGIAYGSLGGNLGQVLNECAGDANVARLLTWDALWICTEQYFMGGQRPTFAGHAGSSIWQATNQGLGGTVDLSVIDLPLRAPGGLWAPPAIDWQTRAQKDEAEIAAARAALGG